MKVFKTIFFTLCCIFATLFSSCEKETPPISSTEEYKENQNRNNDFFSNEKTHTRLAATAHNWNKQNQAIERSDEEKVNTLKDYVDDLDILLSDKYINKIIANEGYPLWDASKIYMLDNGGSLIFTPIFRENSDKVNAVFVFSNFGTDEYSYIMMTRSKMVSIASDPKDPNFHLLNRIYKEFDEELFALDLPQYDDWAELVLAVNVSCYQTLSIADDGLGNISNYVVCSSGCTNALWASGIIDAQEESWVRGNCSESAIVNNYLQDNGVNNSNVVSAADIILGVAILEDLSSNQLSAIITNIGQELIFLLDEGVLSDACAATISSREMVDSVMNTPNIWTYDVNGFYSDLGEQFDYVIEHESFTSNAKIKCLWDLVSSSDTNLFCSTIDNFASSPEFDLFLYVSVSPGRCAITRNNYPQGKISITFDVNCVEERTDIELVKTILHEGIHAEIFRIVKSIGGYENLNSENYPEIWEAYRENEDWSHEFMANWYLNQLATSLAEIDGNSFSTEHYIALAWQGLGENPNDVSHPISIRWEDLSESEQENIIALREELISGSELSCL